MVPSALIECQTAPQACGLLYALPHSGRHYPEDFGAALPHEALRRAEDAYVDRLLGDVLDLGIHTLKALFPRSYVDVNRAEWDLDPEIVDTELPTGPKSELGIGLIRRIVTPETPIYQRRLSMAEVEQRLERCYHPYHRALAQQLEALHQQRPRVVLIDWHSMKSRGNRATPDGEGAQRPDFALGDRHGNSCDAALTQHVADVLRQRGYRVGINQPYAGAHVLQTYAQPTSGRHALQIEINRALYLDEQSWQMHAGADTLSADLRRLSESLRQWMRAPC